MALGMFHPCDKNGMVAGIHNLVSTAFEPGQGFAQQGYTTRAAQPVDGFELVRCSLGEVLRHIALVVPKDVDPIPLTRSEMRQEFAAMIDAYQDHRWVQGDRGK